MKKRNNNWLKLPFSKKSQGHVEFMVSFVLFVSAVIMLFVIINPLKNPESKLKIQENGKDILINNLSIYVGKLDISSEPPYCYKFDSSSYGNVFFESYKNPDSNKRIYEIYFSDFLSNEHLNYKADCNADKYVLGSYISEKIILKSKIIELKKNYEQNYKETKKQIGISNDFVFTFKDKNKKIIEELSVQRETSKNVNKYATEFPVRVIDERANINEMILNINLW